MNDNRQLTRSSSRASQEQQTNSRRIAELVARLLTHYWTADDHRAMRQAQAEDWLEDLAEFPVDVVEVACREWRQSSLRRPTPYEIRSLAVVEQRKRNSDPKPVFDRL